MRYFDQCESPHGPMILAATERGLAGVYFSGQKHMPKRDGWQPAPDNVHIRDARRQLAEYFAGRRRRFELPLDPQGTRFQQSVWKAITSVNYGETISYSELARRAGAPGSARAAGAATGRNPIGIVVPCHRIVGASGALTGYAGGLAMKRALLALEGVST